MKAFIILLALICCLVVPVLGGECLAAGPLAGETLLGTFYVRDIFDSVMVGGSEVSLVWGGTENGTSALVSVVPSPSNPCVIGGYAHIRKTGAKGFLFAYHGMSYRFVFLDENKVTIYVSAE